MNAVVGYAGDDPNSLKEALERAQEEAELRRQFLVRRYGRTGAEAVLAKERTGKGRR